MTRILVTGASGFIGTPLCAALANAGHDVTGLDLLPARDCVGRHVTVDIRDPEQLTSALVDAHPEVVVHLAALHYIPYCNAHPNETVATNVTGTANLIEASARAKVGRFVFASTAAVYRPREEAHKEDEAPGPVDIYGLSKAYAEGSVRAHAQRTGCEVVTARIFNVYGPGDPHLHVIPEVVSQLRLQLGRSGPLLVELGNLSPARDFVHVTDVSSALLLLATDSTMNGGVFNIGSESATSVVDLVAHMESVVGAEIIIREADERKRPVDRPILRADASRLREKGWAPTVPLPTGLKDLLSAI